MTTKPETDPRLASFPPALRQLIDAELAAGNRIVEVASCHPAPPAGAYVKLEKFVSTRPRAKTATLDFYDRNSSLYSGEWTDAKRFYFVVEPPRPPPPESDMDLMRALRNAAAAPASLPYDAASTARPDDLPPEATATRPRRRPATAAVAPTIRQRFEAGMNIDYEKWREGIGYNLDLLREASASDRVEIEALLLRRGVRDWRDVEALAALGTPGAKTALKAAVKSGDAEIRAAVRRHAPKLVTRPQRLAHLVEGLRTAEFYHGLSQTLDEVAAYHPPRVIDALFLGVLERTGEVAVHFAAMLMYLHGRAREPFDWAQRPFFLTFHTADTSEREERFRELCAKVGVAPDKYLRRRTRSRRAPSPRK